jgi:nucleoside-diphosphate-sugar epimerase
MKKMILLTGAAGRIGTSFRNHAADRYEFRLVDRDLEKLGDPGEHEAVQADLADLAVCQELCKGIHTVVHLAADPSARADFYESLLDNNIKSTYNIFRAAKDQGCQRVIFASSVHAVNAYPLDTQVHPDMPVRPGDMYGVTKVFGEATGRYFADVEGLSNISIRIGAYGGNRTNWENAEVDARTLCTFVSARDLDHLIERCIETPDVQFAIVQAVSDNRFKRLDISTTRETVGYAPQDDAFQLFNSGIKYRDRWYAEWNRQARGTPEG